MNKDELILLLEEVASSDDRHLDNFGPHPCTVAIHALNECFEDMDRHLQILWNVATAVSDFPQESSPPPYNPNW